MKYILSAATRDDLDRQVIKSQYATIGLPDIDFEIPPATQSGSLSTVEGVLTHAAKSLEHLQPQRRAVDSITAGKIQDVIDKLRELSTGSQPFVLTLDDPSGQSIIETKAVGSGDYGLASQRYERSVEQNAALGRGKKLQQFIDRFKSGQSNAGLLDDVRKYLSVEATKKAEKAEAAARKKAARDNKRKAGRAKAHLDRIQVGSTVRLREGRQRGEVIELKGKRATVAFGEFRTRVELQDLVWVR